MHGPLELKCPKAASYSMSTAILFWKRNSILLADDRRCFHAIGWASATIGTLLSMPGGEISLFRVWNLRNDVRLACNQEVETPVFVNPSLPNILRLVVFLGPQGRMSEIASNKIDLLDEGLLHSRWSTG